MSRLVAAIAVAGVLGALAGCEDPGVRAPTERTRCFHMVTQGEGAEPRFNRLPGTYPSLEYCAAGLELVRKRGGRAEITGSFHGQFIFIDRRGIFVGESLKSGRYLAMVRTRDGRLAIPGAVQPPPQLTQPGGVAGT